MTGAGSQGAAEAPGPAAVEGRAGSAVDPSLRHLAGKMAIVEARVRAIVAARRKVDPNPDDRFRGLYVSGAQAGALLAGDGPGAWSAGTAGEVGPPGSPADGSPITAAEVEADADLAESQGLQIRLRAMARAFGLGPFDEELLLVALAPDLDPRFERLYGYLNDDVSRRRASAGLALHLGGAPPTAAAGRRRLAATGALVAGGLLEVEDGERPFLTRALRVPDRIVGYLLGDPTPDTRLTGLLAATSEPGSAVSSGGATQAILERGLRAGATLAYFRDHVGSDARGTATAAFDRVQGSSLVLDLELAAPDVDLVAVAVAAGREARLKGGGVVAGPIDALAERGAWLVREFADLPVPVVLHGTRAWDPTWSRTVPLVVDVQPAVADERSRAWRAGLRGLPEADAVGAAMSRYPFRVAVPGIARAAAAARLAARAADRPVTAADLAAGVRAQNATGLERLARRIEPLAAWPDLVLPPDILDHLHDLANRALHRDEVLDGWGLGDPNRGRGLTALFTGDSGTGKTFSAEVVAGTLGLDLYVIDLSSVVDKYIGETEKNLDRVFSQADGVNGVLLFDEADAIFGKRSEVRDARDRYANVEIAYLLQRMEHFDGMAILTTNLRANLDEAFLRRLDVLVDFPMPDEVGRRRLWVRHLPASLPVAADLDLDFLAHRFRISGGNIRNIVAAAAYSAAAAGRPVAMADLIKGTEREYRKLGHLSTEAEFGPYFRLVAS